MNGRGPAGSALAIAPPVPGRSNGSMQGTPRVFQCSACGRVFRGIQVLIAGKYQWAPRKHWAADRSVCAGVNSAAVITDTAVAEALPKRKDPPDMEPALREVLPQDPALVEALLRCYRDSHNIAALFGVVEALFSRFGRELEEEREQRRAQMDRGPEKEEKG